MLMPNSWEEAHQYTKAHCRTAKCPGGSGIEEVESEQCVYQACEANMKECMR